MKKLLLLLLTLHSALNAQAEHSRLYLTTDQRVTVEVFAPIGGFAQESFLTAEFRLPMDSTYLIELEMESPTSISLNLGTQYLQFIVFPNDSICVAQTNGKIEISGSNAEGHKLYIERTNGDYSTLPSNLAKEKLYELSSLTNYDHIVDSLYIQPFEKEMQSLVDEGLIVSDYKEAALNDFCSNLFVTLYNELEWKWAKNKKLSQKQKDEVSTLQDRIKNQRLTLSIAEAAKYPLSNAYIERKAEWDYDKYSKNEKAQLFGRYAKSLPKALRKYLVLPEELRAILMLQHYLYLSESAANLDMAREVSTLKNYIALELKDTEMIQLAKDLVSLPTGELLNEDTRGAKIYLTTDTVANARICAPIAGFAQSFLPDSEFELLPSQMSLTEIKIDQNTEFASLMVTLNDRDLKFMLFAGDSIVVSYQSGNVIVSGTNAAGHNLYLEKIVKDYKAMTGNMILGTKHFEGYEKIIEETLIDPIKRQMDSLNINKRFKEAAINDHKNNIYSYICNELTNHIIENSKGQRKKELIELHRHIEKEHFGMSAEQAARYAQGWNYVSTYAMIDFEKLTTEERAELLGDFAALLPKEISAYFTLNEELRAMCLLWVYRTATENLAYYKQIGASQDELRRYKEQLKKLEDYFDEELADTQAAKLL